MTVADLKKGLTATRAVLPGTIAPAPVLLSSSDRNLDADEQGERT
jgi:hypothetical protein